MREILFKAKHIHAIPEENKHLDGMWVEGYLTDKDHINSLRLAGEYLIDRNTICQFTGLTDKNGKKIWENDIVSNKWCFAKGNSVVRFGEYKDFHMPEKFQCGNLGFFLEHMGKENSYIRKDMMYFAGKCEVVGNVFDNPELLGGAE